MPAQERGLARRITVVLGSLVRPSQGEVARVERIVRGRITEADREAYKRRTIATLASAYCPLPGEVASPWVVTDVINKESARLDSLLPQELDHAVLTDAKEKAGIWGINP